MQSTSTSTPPRQLAAVLLHRQVCRLQAVGSLVGWWQLAWLVPLWLVARRYRIVIWDAAGGSLPRAAFPSGTSPRRVAPDDIGPLTQLNPSWSRRQLERRLAEGCQGFCWMLDGSIVHVRWHSAAPTWLPYLDIGFEPRPGDLLSLEAFTPDRHRRQGHYAAGLAWTLGEARRNGTCRCVFLVAWWNRPVLRYLERSGARIVGRVDALGLGPLRRHRVLGGGRLRGRSALSVDS